MAREQQLPLMLLPMILNGSRVFSQFNWGGGVFSVSWEINHHGVTGGSRQGPGPP